MRLFGCPPDPLDNELRKLERQRRKLEQEETRLRKTMQQPATQAAPGSENGEIVVPKRAIFRTDSTPEEPKTENRRTRKRLKIQHQRARNRFIGICLLILLLALIVYRTMQ